VPLGYLVRWAVLRLLGESSFSARLPSGLFGLAACPGVYFLARRWGASRPALAAAVFAIIPLELRYAGEARAYAQAQCLSIWATVLFLRWTDRPASTGRAVLYGLSVAAGLYTHPYTVFVPLAHFAWLCLLQPGEEEQAKRMRGSAGLVLLAAILLFLPWYIHSARIWSEDAAAYSGSRIGWRAGLLILHEISGAGYFGTAILICGVVLGLRAPRAGRTGRPFLLLYLAGPIAGALAADIVFSYFLAIRQMIFVLAPAAILFGAGVENLFLRRQTVPGILLLAALVVPMLYEDMQLFSRPREDWQTAARLLMETTGTGGCVLFAPRDSVEIYRYFQPRLSERACPTDDPGTADSVAVAVSAYGDAASSTHAADQRWLTRLHWTKVADLNPAGPRIELYRRSVRR